MTTIVDPQTPREYRNVARWWLREARAQQADRRPESKDNSFAYALNMRHAANLAVRFGPAPIGALACAELFDAIRRTCEAPPADDVECKCPTT
jgi:hypothetical protein